jgi:hypothetical protein
MPKELTAAVPLDDGAVDEAAAGDVTGDENGANTGIDALAEGAAQTGDEDAGTDGDEGAGAETDAGADAVDAEALAAVAGDEDDDGASSAGVPLSRFREVNDRRKTVENENAQLRELLMRVTHGDASATDTGATATPRDFDAEFAALQAKYDNGDLDDAEFRKQERVLIREQAKADALAEVNPLLTELQQERERAATERLQAALTAEAAKVYPKYPFLNPANKDRNEEAIAAVLAERDDLIKHGIDPAKSLRMAVAAVAPDYAPQPTAATASGEAVAASRRTGAREKIADTLARQPANLANVGVSGKTGVKPIIGASVKDHDKWEKIPEAERDKVMNG